LLLESSATLADNVHWLLVLVNFSPTKIVQIFAAA
jgi:hypothetical protein